MKKSLVPVFGLAVLVLLAQVTYADEFIITQLTDNEYQDQYPQIEGNNVVWSGNGKIYCYNGTTTTQISQTSISNYLAQISGGNVVWVGNDGNDFEIYLYNGVDVTKLTDNSFHDGSVHIDGNIMTWIGNGELFYYDGSVITQITNNDDGDHMPTISGNNVVWYRAFGYVHDEREIYLYDGSTTTQIRPLHIGINIPTIDGNNIVWVEDDGNDYEIFLYDGTATNQVTNNQYDDGGALFHYNPVVDGNNIVWGGFDGNDYELYLYNGSDIFQLTDNSYDDAYISMKGNNIVWSGFDGNDYEIFLYDGFKTYQVTYNTQHDYDPLIDTNSIVWNGWDGNDYEIFIAEYQSDTYSIFEEDYEEYQIGDDPNIVSNWHVYGLEQTGKSIQGNAENRFLRITFNSPAGNIPPAWAPIVITQDVAWMPSKDFTNATIVFDIRTDLANTVENVLTVEIVAVCNETGLLETFRIPDSALLTLPSSTNVWLRNQVDISELTFNEASWKTPDLTQVEKVQILVLQTVTDIVASGSIDIDNFRAVGVDTSQTITLIEENYNSYSIGSDPNLSSDWFVFGLERLSQVVQGANGDNWVDIAFSSPVGVPPAWCSFGLAQLEAWSVLKDFTDATIKVDIKTDLSQSILNVMALEVFAVCNETGLVESFRIPDANLITLPASSEGWVNIEVDISDLTYNENTWKTPDYSQIEKIQVLFLQTATDIVATGTVSIDNLKVEKSSE